jgi:uncharacterized membrane protein
LTAKQRTKSHQRLIALAATIILVVVVVVVAHITNNSVYQTPSTALQGAYNRLGVSQPSTYNDNTQDGLIQAVFSGLDSFSKVHNEAVGQGWHLKSTVFDTSGNPVYTYTKTVSGHNLELVLSQDIISLNDRRTDLTISIVK